jgi:hypothetical protein
VDGTDGNEARLHEDVHAALRPDPPPPPAPEPGQDDLRIIHDGLLGDAFIRRHVVTFDVAEERIVFA